MFELRVRIVHLTVKGSIEIQIIPQPSVVFSKIAIPIEDPCQKQYLLEHHVKEWFPNINLR